MTHAKPDDFETVEGSTTASSTFLLPNRVYDILKPTVQLILPGLGTLYFALAGIWGLPKAEEVLGTITAIATFLGIILGLSSRAHNTSDRAFDGVMEISHTDSSLIHQLQINTPPEVLKGKNDIRFKVEKH